MSVRAIARVWDYAIESLTDKLVLLAYVDHADDDGRNIYPAVATVAHKTGATRRTVQRATRRLEEMGLLVPDGEGPHGTNRWCLNMSWKGGRTGDASLEAEGAYQVRGGGVSDDQKGRTADARTVLNRPLTNGEDAPQPYDVFLVWCDVLGYDANKVSKTKKGQELNYAKELLNVSWELVDVRGCLADLAGQDYWQDKPLSLCHVAREINGWKQRQTTKRSIAM